MIRSTLTAALLTVLAGTALAAVPASSAPAAPPRALWVWNTTTLRHDPEAARTFFDWVATKRSGLSFAIASASVWAKILTSSQPAFGLSGTTTWRPFPPVVFTKLSRPESRSRSRTSRAASMSAFHETSSAGSRSIVIRSGFSTSPIVEPQG